MLEIDMNIVPDDPIELTLNDRDLDMQVSSTYVTKDHSLLENRDLPDQHPMGAISGLNDAFTDVDTAINTLVPDVSKLTRAIPYGTCDATSTATAFTATVPGITELKDGVCCLIKNGIVTSAAGCTLDINGLGAKPLYSSMAAATAITTVFNVNYTLLFIYDEDRTAGGCWVAYYGYYTSSNTIGYQLRTNSTRLPVSSTCYRYRLLFTRDNGYQFMPANNSTSTNATSSRTPCSETFDPFGRICYYGYTTALSAGGKPGASYLWDQYVVTLGYSFTNPTLTEWLPVYIKATPTANGMAVLDSTEPWTQSLPTSADGKIYIYLGVAVSTTTVEIVPHHPIYYYDSGAVKHWYG